MDILSSPSSVQQILLESFSAASFISKAIITIIVIYLAQLVENNFAKKRRARLATKQRDLYYNKLEEEKSKMEEKRLQEEMEQAKCLENVKRENHELRDQLDEEFINDDDGDDNEHDDSEEGSDWSSNKNYGDDKIKEEKKQLHELQEKAQELKEVDSEITCSIKNLKKDDILKEPISEPPPIQQKHINSDDDGGDGDYDDDEGSDNNITRNYESALRELTDRIKEIELENEELKAQVKSYSSLTLAKQQTKLDPELKQYLEDHSDVLTLDFLEKAHETLIEIKATNPDKNFDDYISELKCAQRNFDLELENLRVNKKEAEIKLKLMKQEYEKELASFNEIRIEHIFKNSGAKEYLERLQEKNKLNEELIKNLKTELEATKTALTDCEARYARAEAEYQTMFHGHQQMKIEKEQIEAERRAKERRMLNQSMNLSSASSLVEPIPMPLLNNIPSIDELLNETSPRQHHH